MSRPALAVAALFLLLALLARPVGRMFTPAPTLDTARSLMNAGHFAAAEPRIRRYLSAFPDDPEAQLLLAQALVDRPSPDPAAALTLLKRTRQPDAARRAIALVTEGKALYRLQRHGIAETAWKSALGADRTVPEATWLLVQLYYVEGREDESRALVLSHFAAEPDPRDRVRLLLELVREDVDHLAAAGLIRDLAPAYKETPDDPRVALAFGGALVRDGRVDEGLPLLKVNVDRHKNDAASWEGYLTGLAEAGDPSRFASEVASLPKSLRDSPRFAGFHGRVAQERGDYAGAVAAYRTHLAAAPFDPTRLHRLGRAARLAKEPDAEAVLKREEEVKATREAQRALYQEVSARPDLGLRPDPDLYHRLADLRESLGHRDEASAWRSLAKARTN